VAAARFIFANVVVGRERQAYASERAEGRVARRNEMTWRRCGWIALAGLLIAGRTGAQQAAPAAGGAQAKPADAQEMAKLGTVSNPVSGALKTFAPRYSKNMVAAAEAMPADKYAFKPSPEMNSFGHLVMHIAQTNNVLCSKVSGEAAPDVKFNESDPKDKLVAALKDSFEYCSKTLEKVDDSKLGDQMMVFGNHPTSRAAAMMMLGGSWTDHYATEAIYLRLNGILPPTAQPAPK